MRNRKLGRKRWIIPPMIIFLMVTLAVIVITALLAPVIAPIMPSPTYHKYDATDYYGIDLHAIGFIKAVFQLFPVLNPDFVINNK